MFYSLYENEDMDLVFPFDSSWVRLTQLEIPTPDQSVEVMPKEDKPDKPKRPGVYLRKGKVYTKCHVMTLVVANIRKICNLQNLYRLSNKKSEITNIWSFAILEIQAVCPVWQY